MGLDFYGSKAHWSYSGFNHFRKRLANEIGIDLENIQGYGGNLSLNKLQDDIKSLLDHSDCDGELSFQECEKVAPRLRELISDWDDDDYDKVQALLLAEGMEDCATNKQSLIFT